MLKISKQNIFKINGNNVDCEFTLMPGINLLTGSNGIGKTSFLRYIKGNSNFFGAMKLSFMDQFPLSPINNIRVRDIINILKEEIFDFNGNLMDSYLKDFNLTGILDREVKLLSGGENQLLKFALLMGQNADLYILDEPLQYLDGKNLQMVINKIVTTSQEKIFLIIEHRKEVLQEVASHSIEMIKEHQDISLRDSDGI